MDETIYKNPSLSELDRLVRDRDYRGITDGKSVFVWDANQMIHGEATWAIAAAMMWEGETLPPLPNEKRVSPRYHPNRDCFYVFDSLNPIPTAQDREDWVGRPGHEEIRLTPHCTIVIVEGAETYLRGLPSFARLLRPNRIT